jgi:hypothetical protein
VSYLYLFSNDYTQYIKEYTVIHTKANTHKYISSDTYANEYKNYTHISICTYTYNTHIHVHPTNVVYTQICINMSKHITQICMLNR